jgi:guanylate kinase
VTARAAPVVLAATSGTGKTTLARRLVEGSRSFVVSVSVTTRAPRERERDGAAYHFVSRDEFEASVARGELAEWAEVHGHLYGTPRVEVDTAAEQGKHVVLDIDVQGARQIRDSMPDAMLIFVLPPSVGIMMARLMGRGSEGRADMARRLQSAMMELQAVPEFDYVVVNDDLEECLDEIRGIVEGRGIVGTPEQDAEEFRAEIARLLAEEYAKYVNVTE